MSILVFGGRKIINNMTRSKQYVKQTIYNAMGTEKPKKYFCFTPPFTYTQDEQKRHEEVNLHHSTKKIYYLNPGLLKDGPSYSLLMKKKDAQNVHLELNTGSSIREQ